MVGHHDLHDLRFFSLKEICDRESTSLSTLKRKFRDGDGPELTQLSKRRVAVRADHYKAWCDRRVRGAVAA
jgi:predicted DNA-binding transcriptional regulator AlpA